jgi:aryl-alcohol dehydrogenase-like predicted oxidoreductase
MRRFVLRDSGVELSSVGLGGVWLRSEAGEDAERVLQASYETGVNWVDTAEGYGDGDNESTLGTALHALPEMLVASKISPWRSSYRAPDVHRACRATLQRLRRDVLDVYFVHAPSPDVPLAETWTAMGELVDAGLVRSIGLSNFPIDEVREADAIRPVDVVQDGLSLIDHLENRAHFAACAELGIAGVAYEPLANALLSGAITADSDLSWVREWPALYDRLFAPGRLERSLGAADGLRAVAAKSGDTMAQLAIGWCLRQPGVDAVLAGTTNVKHARSNAVAAGLTLTDEQLAELEDVVASGPAFS